MTPRQYEQYGGTTEAPKKTRGCLKPAMIGCGGLVGLVVIGGMILGWMMEAGYVADSRVVSGDEVSPRIRGQLEELVLEEGEEIERFSSVDLWSVKGDGQLLTNRRLVSWEEAHPRGEHPAVDLRDITFVDAEFGKGFLEFTWLTVYFGEDPENPDYADSLLVGLSTERRGDLTFVRETVELALAAGAEIETVELRGAVTDEQIGTVPGAFRGEAEPEPE